MDWQDTERVVRDSWRDLVKSVAEAFSAVAPRIEHDPEYQFLRALLSWRDGDPADIVAWMNSERPLYREPLALLFEGKLDKKARVGRPRNELEYMAALAAWRFYRQWRKENERRSIDDYGRSDAMKDASIRAVMEMDARLVCDPDKVRARMDKL
jgi:hypothetical protein